MSQSRTAVAAGGLALALLAGATVGAGSAGASAPRKTADFRVTKAGYVFGPSHLVPGRVKIHVKGSKSQSFQLVRSRHGAGASQLLADAGKLNSGGDPIPLEKDFALLGGVPVHESMWTTLTRGTYYAVDVNAKTQSRNKVHRIIVRGHKKNAAKPHTDGTLRAVRSEDWSSKPMSIAHVGTLRFTNDADQSHFIDLERLKAGKTRKDITAALKGTVKPSSVFVSAKGNSYDSGVLSPGRTASLTYSLPKGRYALLCFWPDRKTHMPHAFMGMYRVITLK